LLGRSSAATAAVAIVAVGRIVVCVHECNTTDLSHDIIGNTKNPEVWNPTPTGNAPEALLATPLACSLAFLKEVFYSSFYGD
jgi:hypothetical protein